MGMYKNHTNTFGGMDVSVTSLKNLIFRDTAVRFLLKDQLDAQILFNVFIYLQLYTCFEHVVLIIRRDKLY